MALIPFPQGYSLAPAARRFLDPVSSRQGVRGVEEVAPQVAVGWPRRCPLMSPATVRCQCLESRRRRTPPSVRVPLDAQIRTQEQLKNATGGWAWDLPGRGCANVLLDTALTSPIGVGWTVYCEWRGWGWRIEGLDWADKKMRYFIACSNEGLFFLSEEKA